MLCSQTKDDHFFVCHIRRQGQSLIGVLQINRHNLHDCSFRDIILRCVSSFNFLWERKSPRKRGHSDQEAASYTPNHKTAGATQWVCGGQWTGNVAVFKDRWCEGEIAGNKRRGRSWQMIGKSG